jgi:hypothetical protein
MYQFVTQKEKTKKDAKKKKKKNRRTLVTYGRVANVFAEQVRIQIFISMLIRANTNNHILFTLNG